jgi:formate C-acetyltransferase
MADALYAIKTLVYDEKKYTLEQFADALRNNYGEAFNELLATNLTSAVVGELAEKGKKVTEKEIADIYLKVKENATAPDKKAFYDKLRNDINELPKFGNDNLEVDLFARDVAYTYTKPLQTYKNPRGGIFHAGLYPVSANVPLGAQTGATPDGRLAGTPVADGVSPAAGRDTKGPTASCNSVARLDHFIASNGTLFNMKFHPSALKGKSGLESFVALVCGYFEQKGMHMQFNVVSRETLLEAQKNPEKYKSLVVRVAGYSALFTTLSRSLQDDIINRTEQGGI